MNNVDWEFLGVQLLERERRPVLVLDLSGRVARANRAFVFLLAEGTRTQNVDFRGEWLREDSRPAWDVALAKVARGERTQVTVSLVNTLFPLDLVLELVPIGDRAAPAVMVVMIEALGRAGLLPLSPAAGVTYEVSLDGEGARRVTRVSAADDLSVRRGGPEVPCWTQIFGRATECEACPVRKLGASGRAAVVAHSAVSQFGATVLVAERRGEQTAAVTAFPIDGALYSGLVTARVDHIAEQAKLTQREKDLLSLLLLGRSLDDIAVVMSITARTAKYHKQNLLRKLGADSSLDLFRLLL